MNETHMLLIDIVESMIFELISILILCCSLLILKPMEFIEDAHRFRLLKMQKNNTRTQLSP